MGIFGLDKEKTPAVVPDTTSEAAETETEKHVALAKELQTDLGIKFDSETAKERIPLMSYKTLLVMQSAAKQFP
ncbi:hypothetical protein KA013_01520 [Patescibacteria group bacterium]|nr:hypothetical protein [Patescibacteria group bacterium]